MIIDLFAEALNPTCSPDRFRDIAVILAHDSVCARLARTIIGHLGGSAPRNYSPDQLAARAQTMRENQKRRWAGR